MAGNLRVRRMLARAVGLAMVVAVGVGAPGAPARAGAGGGTGRSAPLLTPEQRLVYVQGHDADEAASAVRDAGLQVVTTWRRVAMVVAVGEGDDLRRLEEDPRISAVHPDGPVQLYQDNTGHIATRADEARTAKHLTDAHGLAFDGTGVTIAVNDSGIDGTHEMFNEPGKRKLVRNLRTACTDAVRCDAMLGVDGFNDPDGHGTHLAGVAAGYERTTPRGWHVRGVATGSTLVSLGSDVNTGMFGFLNGLNWVLEHHADPCGDGSCPPIKVVTNSWGFYEGPWVAAGDALTSALVDAGVVVVFAAGNVDPVLNPEGVTNAFGHLQKPGVISVANYDDGQAGWRDNVIDPSSSRGTPGRPETWPDLAAPGTNITSACNVLSAYRCGLGPFAGDPPAYADLTGTSPAAPYVAGVVALLLQANPDLTPAQVEDLLEDTAHQFGPADYVADATNPDHRTSPDRGHGLVDVTAALAAAKHRKLPAWVCGSSVIVDGLGDADSLSETGGRELFGVGGTAIDIDRAWITTDIHRRVLRFSVHVTDLGLLPPPGGIGESFGYELTYLGASYRLILTRIGGSVTPEVHFRLQQGNTADRVVVADGLRGAFDANGDLVWAEVPMDAFTRWNPAIPPLMAGSELTHLWVHAAPQISASPFDQSSLGRHDVARTPCSYVVPAR